MWVEVVDAPSHPWERRAGRVVDVVDGVARVWHPFEQVGALQSYPVGGLRAAPARAPARERWTTDVAGAAHYAELAYVGPELSMRARRALGGAPVRDAEELEEIDRLDRMPRRRP